MAAFQILDHHDKLEPDGGRDSPSGDRSYKCPACGADNFKVNHRNGKWDNYSCECSKAEIRNAINPAINPNGAKQQRPKQQRRWEYVTPITHERGQAALAVHRIDDGKGTRKIWQESLIDGQRAAAVKEKVLPYRLPEALKELEAGAAHIYWVEGEPCVDRLWELGLPAVTSIGGAGKFNPERDAGHIPPEQLVVVPDRDQPGVKHMEQVAAAHPGCQWLYPFPGTSQWNGSCPTSGGVDIADWIDAGAGLQQIVAEIGPKLEHPPEPVAEPEGGADGDLTPIDEWDQLLKGLVDPKSPAFEKNSIRRQIRAATAARELSVAASPQHVRATLLQHQRNLVTGTSQKGTKGGEKAKFKPKEYLINNLIAMRCLTGIAAFNKVGKTKLATELVASLITQQPFMGNPEWMPAPGHHKFILWWVDQPGADSEVYLKARASWRPMAPCTRRSWRSTPRKTTWLGMTKAWIN